MKREDSSLTCCISPAFFPKSSIFPTISVKIFPILVICPDAVSTSPACAVAPFAISSTAFPISEDVSLPFCAIASSCSPDCFTFAEIFCALRMTSVSFSRNLFTYLPNTENSSFPFSYARTVKSPSVIWESVVLNLPMLRFMERLVCKVITMINPALIIRIRTITRINCTFVACVLLSTSERICEVSFVNVFESFVFSVFSSSTWLSFSFAESNAAFFVFIRSVSDFCRSSLLPYNAILFIISAKRSVILCASSATSFPSTTCLLYVAKFPFNVSNAPLKSYLSEKALAIWKPDGACLYASV